MHLSTCDYCDGDYEFEVEDPDDDVGLMGYSVFLDNTEFKTHDPECPVRTMTPKEIEEIEYKLSIKVAEGLLDYDPY